MAQRLKSLELQGYKTFANRTLFVFSEAVTAIVGPNGSGKSNIADAIRWVLGEQSFTLLRGRKTEDMIFSGSELRARAGMAQATMVFDNAEQWLPIEFSEVAITRRAYRDGQNEYLINGQRVRLKDVNELLARSGLAERTYTVIGQGLVDVALALKAEDRRQLFEEAAAIGLYRDRREEALRRLDATKRNIERIYDLLSEIEPRLRSLEKQVKRLEEYEQVRSVLKQLLLEWYGYHWHREQKELILQKEFVKQREQAIHQMRIQLAVKEEELSQIRLQTNAKREQLSQWQQALNRLIEAHYLNARQLAVFEERLSSLRSTRMNLEAECNRFREEEKYLEEKLQEAQQEQAALEAEYQGVFEQTKVAREKFAQQNEQYNQKKAALEAINAQYTALLRQNAESEARLHELMQRRTQRVNLSKEREAEVANLEKELLLKKEELEGFRQERATHLETYHRYQQLLERLEQELQVKLDQRIDKQKQRAKLEAERVKLSTQLTVLEQADQALTDYSQAVKALYRQRERNGIVGVLGSMLHIPPEYEIAVAAYLGEFAEMILIRDADRAAKAAEFLSKENLRGVLLPLEGKAVSTEVPALTKKGTIGWLKDLIQIDSPYQDVLEKVFYRVLLVENSKIAQEYQRTLSDPPILVTLNGELYYPQGWMVSAGKIEAGKLRRPREKQEIRQRLHLLEKQITTLDQEINDLEKQIEQTHTQKATLHQQRARIQEKLNAIEKESNQRNQELERTRIRQELIVRQLGELQIESISLQNEIETEKKTIEAIGQQLPRLEVQLREQSQQLAEVSLEQLIREVDQWEAYLQTAERSLSSARKRTQERLQQLERVKQRILHLEEQQQDTEQQITDIEAKIATLKDQEQENQQKQNELLIKIEPLKQEIEGEESQLEAFNGEIQELQHSLLQQEQSVAQLRITLTRQQERFDALRRKIEEDFGLVAFEYDEDVSGQRPLPLEGMVETLPNVLQISPDLEENIRRYRQQLRRLGPVSQEAKVEYEQVKERYRFMQEQIADLLKAEADILEILRQLDQTIRQDFLKTYEAVAEEFKTIFMRLFKGGSARLFLTDPDDLTNAGIEIEARLPGKRTQGLSLLSGGERSLTAVALIFALLKVSPTPFCVLDEVDAMLDEANVGRFQEVLRELSRNTQFIIVTHNRNTVQVADIIYGVTMGRDSTSQVMSLKLDELDRVIG
ncbi:MAG: chromosome segregation protein SMC [Anaerolineae bacterium]|nr:MAG: chromosome segregation protein SMC [Anaerolineae bacterium]